MPAKSNNRKSVITATTENETMGAPIRNNASSSTQHGIKDIAITTLDDMESEKLLQIIGDKFIAEEYPTNSKLHASLIKNLDILHELNNREMPTVGYVCTWISKY